MGEEFSFPANTPIDFRHSILVELLSEASVHFSTDVTEPHANTIPPESISRFEVIELGILWLGFGATAIMDIPHRHTRVRPASTNVNLAQKRQSFARKCLNHCELPEPDGYRAL